MSFLDFNDWERSITDQLIVMLDITNGDAQGILEAHPFVMSQEWAKGSSPEIAVQRLTNLINN